MRPRLLLAALVLLLGIVVFHPDAESAQPVAIATTGATVTAEPAPSPHAGVKPEQALIDGLTKAQAEQEATLAHFYNIVHFYDVARAQQAAAPSTRRSPRAAIATAPATDAAPAPEPVDGGDAEAAVRAWFPDLFSQAWGVSGCESGHDPSAISPGGGNFGLFQLNAVHRNSFTEVTGQPWSAVLNANYNAQFARWLYDSSGGWGPWACKWAAR